MASVERLADRVLLHARSTIGVDFGVSRVMICDDKHPKTIALVHRIVMICDI
jgi:hypothetical protein